MVSLAQTIPFAVRALRSCLIIVPAFALIVAAPGCGHRRSVMRPVFGTPVPTTSPVLAAPVDAAGCSTSPTMTTIPDASDPFVNSAAIPSAAGPGGDVRRAGGGSPPAADVPAEPELDAPRLSPVNPTSARSSGSGAGRAARGVGRQSSVTTRRARLTLREAVAPFVENPDDLFAPPKADRPWRYVVLHHSAGATGGLDQVDRDHRKMLGFEGCGYHFVIGNGTDSPDGRIEVADRWLNQKNGVHCRNGRTPEVNEYGIGICLVGNFDQAEPTPKQVAAARALVAYLGDRYAIAADRRGTHADFADGPTDCPGKNFPAEAILGTAHVASR